MRIIAGRYRSRLLGSPRGFSTRPTSDRLRETLFNVLTPQLDGAAFADLYAGSGAVGIEALSRGAGHVLFIENAPAALAAIRANLAALDIRSGFQLEERSVSATLRNFHRSPGARPWNLVFLDPPYSDIDAYSGTLSALGQPDPLLLASEATVIAEHPRRQQLQEDYGSIHRIRVLEQGDAMLSFYRHEPVRVRLPQDRPLRSR